MAPPAAMQSMDRPAAFQQAPACPGHPPTHPEEAEHHQRDRRREKTQLSCGFCRRRKLRCDRQLPCKACLSKGIALSCTYTPRKDVGEGIQQLEALVRSLMQRQQQQQQQQQTPQTSAVPQCSPFPDSPTQPFGHVPSESWPGTTTPLASVDDDDTAASPLIKDGSTSGHGTTTRLHDNYVSSVHWAAVLDSISELKDHHEREEEEEARTLATSDYVPPYRPAGPRLLYEPVQASKADILASIPARPVVDRMVARYYNAQGATSAILHSGQFLREYEGFWQDPPAAPFALIGLLFSIMCLSTQHQQLIEVQADPDTLMLVHTFRERTVHCLVLGQFTRGGPHVLETMINYCASEGLLCKDADIGLWLLLGMVVQVALSMGYHRDPRSFSNISPFAGEMRRRVWAAVAQMDLRISSQMGLPHLLKSQQRDTAEPRNLLDSDFDEATVELPPSRPETEVTPVLYGLAKNRIDSISRLIDDLVAGTEEHPYPAIMDLDRKLQEAEASLPPAFRWQPLSRSFMVPPHIVLYRVWLQLTVQRLVIWLHRRYLAPSYDQVRYEYSRNACVQAAVKILEFQQLVDEETQADGQLYHVRWMQSSLMQSIFLLGMSVLCYYLQLAKTTPDVLLDRDTCARFHGLLRNTYPMWLRSSTVSRDARKAVEHLDLLLGLRSQQMVAPLAQEATTHVATPQNVDNSHTWDLFQDCIANFPAAFDTEFFMALDAPA